MKINTPVTTVEHPYPRGQILVSTTDLKGAITYANDVFVSISGLPTGRRLPTSSTGFISRICNSQFKTDRSDSYLNWN